MLLADNKSNATMDFVEPTDALNDTATADAPSDTDVLNTSTGVVNEAIDEEVLPNIDQEGVIDGESNATTMATEEQSNEEQSNATQPAEEQSNATQPVEEQSNAIQEARIAVPVPAAAPESD